MEVEGAVADAPRAGACGLKGSTAHGNPEIGPACDRRGNAAMGILSGASVEGLIANCRRSGLFNHGFSLVGFSPPALCSGFVQPRLSLVGFSPALRSRFVQPRLSLVGFSPPARAQIGRAPGLFNHSFCVWASPLWQRLNLPCSCRGSRSRLFAPGRFVRPQPMAAGFSLPQFSSLTCFTCTHRPGRVSPAQSSNSLGVSWSRSQSRRSQVSPPRSRQTLK